MNDSFKLSENFMHYRLQLCVRENNDYIIGIPNNFHTGAQSSYCPALCPIMQIYKGSPSSLLLLHNK